MQQKNNILIIVAGIIPLCLLGIYAFTVVDLIKFASNNGSRCEYISDNTYWIAAIEGLLSALAVSRLSLTEPKKTWKPWNVRTANEPQKITNLANIALVVWLIVGLLTVYFGILKTPSNANTTLNELGQNWLGTAVASTYAYLGIKPKK